jgi:integrase
LSLNKDKRSPFYRYIFQIDGRRFWGKTKKTTKREAEAVEAAARREAERQVALERAAATSLKLNDVASRYWNEIGQHHAGADNTWRLIGELIKYFGKDILITNITDDDVARLVAWRRGHTRRDGKLISAFTVNDLTEQLKKLFTRAKVWGVRFEHEPKWRDHWLKEPEERVRELVGDEHERLQAAMRDDYAPLFDLAHATGLRLNELVTLRWSEVDFGNRQITKAGKGDRRITTPITPTIREILWPLRGHHPEFVFTYVARRTENGRVRGERYPMAYNSVRKQFQLTRKRSGVVGFRLHDYRHDVGTKLLRATGNLKLVQRALNHANIGATTKYAHVLDDEVADAMESRLRTNNHTNPSLKKIS